MSEAAPTSLAATLPNLERWGASVQSVSEAATAAERPMGPDQRSIDGLGLALVRTEGGVARLVAFQA